MNAAEPGIQFRRDKFLAAIHKIIELCDGDPQLLGKTKLHKSLYYADMLSFLAAGEPITGVEYIKSPFGPTARYLDWGLDQLGKMGRIRISREDYFGLSKYRYDSLVPADSNLLDLNEAGLIREVTDFVCKQSARAISEFSHSTPWQSVTMGGRIPYSSAFELLPDSQPTDADRRWAGDQLEIVRRLTSA